MKLLLLIWPWDSNYIEQIWSTKHIYDFGTTIHNQYVTDQHLTHLHQQHINNKNQMRDQIMTHHREIYPANNSKPFQFTNLLGTHCKNNAKH